jgi:hypothetical protein
VLPHGQEGDGRGHAVVVAVGGGVLVIGVGASATGGPVVVPIRRPGLLRATRVDAVVGPEASIGSNDGDGV